MKMQLPNYKKVISLMFVNLIKEKYSNSQSLILSDILDKNDLDLMYYSQLNLDERKEIIENVIKETGVVLIDLESEKDN